VTNGVVRDHGGPGGSGSGHGVGRVAREHDEKNDEEEINQHHENDHDWKQFTTCIAEERAAAARAGKREEHLLIIGSIYNLATSKLIVAFIAVKSIFLSHRITIKHVYIIQYVYEEISL
jgi:hypothetical protein